MAGFDELQFGEWVIAADCSTARSNTQPPVEFTPQEQAVLARFTQHPGQVVSREMLLDVLDPGYDGVGHRSVDFIVNRLRRKLRDDARNPRFIATRYGGGYVWLVKGRPIVGQVAPVLGVEAIYGLGQLRESGIGTQALRAFANQLGERLQWLCVFPTALGLPRPTTLGQGDARFRMDVSVLDDPTHLHVSLSIRDSRTNQLVKFMTSHCALPEAVERMADVAAEVVSALWSQLMLEQQPAQEGPKEQPLHVRAHEAGLLLARSPQYWLELEARIHQARQETPEDPRLCVLWAANRYARLLLSFGADEAQTTQLFAEYENSIEAEILKALPGLEDLPAYQLTAAMLLLTLARDHENLAEALIEKAFWNEAPFASVFSLRARLCLCRGSRNRSPGSTARWRCRQWAASFRCICSC